MDGVLPGSRARGRALKRTLRRVAIAAVALQVGMALAGVAARRLFPSQGDEASDAIALNAIMTSTALVSRARAFRGGSVLTVMGGTRLDLRSASIAPGGATLRARAVMGGVDVRVPAGWRVALRARGALGGIDDRTADDVLPEDAPVLEIRAVALLGGIEIRR